MDLPIYEMKLSEQGGIDAIAFVDTPAIGMKFDYFNGVNQQFTADSEQRVVSGAAMVAGMSIYRRDETIGEYYAVFSAETIKSLVQKYFKSNKGNVVNKMHDSNQMVDGVYMFESFIIDRARGISPPKGHEYATDGSWFVSYKIDNDDVWENDVKTNKFKGFSIEGMFEPIHQAMGKQTTDIEGELEKIKQLILNKK